MPAEGTGISTACVYGGMAANFLKPTRRGEADQSGQTTCRNIVLLQVCLRSMLLTGIPAMQAVCRT